MKVYLYIKRHEVTRKLYFGKTTKDPMKYPGSGFYWLRHLRVHGPHVKTLWFRGFEDQVECTTFALKFSEKHHIVDSDRWLNLKPENGLDGTVSGTKFGPTSKEVRAKISARLMGHPKSDAHRKNISLSHTGKRWSVLQREKITEAKAASSVKPGPRTTDGRRR